MYGSGSRIGIKWTIIACRPQSIRKDLRLEHCAGRAGGLGIALIGMLTFPGGARMIPLPSETILDSGARVDHGTIDCT